MGEYLDTQGYGEPVIDTLSGGTWSSAEGPLPADAATDAGPTNFPNADRYSVSCASTSSCVAVGSYKNTSGVDSGFVAILSGSAWTAQAAPLPSNAVATGGHFLTTVSCSSATFCVAGGAYRDKHVHAPVQRLVGDRHQREPDRHPGSGAGGRRR